MPTDPVRSILDRDLARANVKGVADAAASLLEETVNRATGFFATVADTSRYRMGENESLAPYFVYLHTIEMADGVQELASQGCDRPIVLLVRSQSESLMSLQYMLEDESLWVRRSLSWTYCQYWRQRQMYRSLNPETQEGKQASRDFEADAAIDSFSVDSKVAAAAAANLDQFLDRDQFCEIAEEFQRVKARRRGAFPWYVMFHGPRNLEELARHLERPAVYRYFYRSLSATAHAQDPQALLRHLTGQASTPFVLRSDVEQLGSLSQHSARMLVDATRLLLQRFRPAEMENLSRWYASEFVPRRDRLAELNARAIEGLLKR